MADAARQPQALVAEDEPGLLAVYRHVLKKMDFEVLEAITGGQAMALLEQHTPRILFLDMHLPEVDGQVILEYIRDTPRLQALKVVIATADKNTERYATYLDRVEFLLKPVLPNQIRQLAAAVL